MFEVDTSTYHYKSRRPEQASLEARIREICQTRVFERPVFEDSHPALAGQLLEMADRSVAKGLKRIGIDTERYDIDAEILNRSVDEALRTMKREGLFNE